MNFASGTAHHEYTDRLHTHMVPSATQKAEQTMLYHHLPVLLGHEELAISPVLVYPHIITIWRVCHLQGPQPP